MIKRTLYFGNPAYLSLTNTQLCVRLPEVEKNDTLPDFFKKEVTKMIPIEDIGIVVLDHQQITITQALLDNNVALISCNYTHLPTGLMLSKELDTSFNSKQSKLFGQIINDICWKIKTDGLGNILTVLK
jgi:CRISP-associated protein Cas1